jgi:hypothetical protein
MSFAVRARSPSGSIISVCVSKAESALEVSRRMATLQAKQITIYVGATGRSYRRCSYTGHFSSLEKNSRILICAGSAPYHSARLSLRVKGLVPNHGEHVPRTSEPRHHRSDGNVHHLSDLCVGQFVHLP